MEIDYNSAIALVDTNYMIFARTHAIICWYKLNQNDNSNKKETNYFKIPVFMDKYNSLFLKNLKDIIFAKDIKSVIFALDCEKKNIWRNEYSIQPYKGTRIFNMDEGMKEIFKYTIDNIIMPFVKENKYGVLYVNNAEADDINAVLTKYIHYKNPKTNIYIISADNDYNQLLDDYTHKLTITTSRGKTNIVKNSCLNKILEGDKSDNISACKMISPNTGKIINLNDKNFKKKYPNKSYEDIYGHLLNYLYTNIATNNKYKDAITKTLTENTDEIEKYVIDAKQFINNQVLIDFKCIPIDIVKNILLLIDADSNFNYHYNN